MAAKKRAPRTTRSSKRRSSRKRVATAAKPHRAKVRTEAGTKSRAKYSAKSRAKAPIKTHVKARATKAGPDVIQIALAAFAHEVRTPLTGILAISDLLATSDLGERERRWVDTIKAGAEHLANLATLFVDAAGGARGETALRQDLFDLRALAHAVSDSLAGRAAAKGLQAEVFVAPKLPGLVIGDAVRLRAALENLIDNAVKFTEEGWVAMSVEPWRPPKNQGKRKDKGKVGVSFKVSDSGIGLTMAEIKRLFRPFSQANVTIASRFGGAGLGLSSVKQLARMMGGDITATTRGARGAAFTLTVTLSPAEEFDVSMLNGEGAPPAMRALRVLSVEDNPFGRVVLNTILTELGHQAEFIGRGEDAENRLTQGAFDVVLMDMVLPGINGIEAIRRIRGLSAPLRDIPIIGISGRGEDEAASRNAGADAFLVKPVSPRALATALLEARRREEAAT